MMSCYLVLSPSIVKRAGAWTANTTMFGTASIVILMVQATRGTIPSTDLSTFGMGLLLFIGTATAGVFLLRSRALQSLSPAVVGGYNNLIPICTIGMACLWLSEALSIRTLMGAFGVVAGTELIRRGPRFGRQLGDQRVDMSHKPLREDLMEAPEISSDTPARVAYRG